MAGRLHSDGGEQGQTTKPRLYHGDRAGIFLTGLAWLGGGGGGGEGQTLLLPYSEK